VLVVFIQRYRPNVDRFFRFLKERCHGNQFWAKLAKLTFIQHAGVLKWIRISQFDLQMPKWKYLATFCAILMKISPVKPRGETNCWNDKAKIGMYKK